jgi:hypothetical protein
MKNNMIMAFLGLVIALTTPGAYAAEEFGGHWLWSARTPAVNRSTEALATGHAARAAHLAHVAYGAAMHAPEQVIALHNLCLALIALGTAADVACRTAIQSAAALPPAQDCAIHRRGSFVVGVPAEGEIFSLARLVHDNIARAYGAQVVNDMAKEG